MSRNSVRGPTSALTEFLRESGITPTTVAQRAATQSQAVAGPIDINEGDAGGEAEEGGTSGRPGRRRTSANNTAGYASDELDEPEAAPEQTAPEKKRKLTKAAEAKLKAKEKAKKKKGGEDGEYEEEDPYTALSKSLWNNGASSSSKPPVGSFETCVTCEKQFTVTKYTMAANPGPGFLCHQCAKASGSDPFKKPASKKKAPADKRTVVNFEEKRFQSLVSLCVQLITRHIDDVDALGNIGAINMEAISKALSKNRSLTSENATLFYNTQNTTLTLYDATNLNSQAFTTLAYLNPNLTSLRLDFCGRIDDDALSVFTRSLPHLTRIELLGPFLVHPSAWAAFFEAHPCLEAFLITQSPRFDLECIKALVANCGEQLKELRLKEIGKMDDAFLEEIAKVKKLTSLDISDPSHSCSQDTVIDLLSAVGSALVHLNLSKHNLLTDEFLEQGLKPHTRVLESLVLSHLPELTDKGVSDFFSTWTENPPLVSLDLSRNPALASDALVSVLKHSGEKLQVLDINGWKGVGEAALRDVARLGKQLRRVDVGWCREMDDFIAKAWMEEGVDSKGRVRGCDKLEELKVWGCNKITERCPRKRGVSIYGIESQSVL